MPNREVIASPIAYTDTFTHAGFSGLLSKVNDICDIQIPLLSLPVQVYGTSIKLPAWFSIFSMWKLISLNMIFDPLFLFLFLFLSMMMPQTQRSRARWNFRSFPQV